MTRHRKVVRLFTLVLAAFVLLVCCCWWDSRWFDYWPVDDASHEARRQAEASGYRMEGYLGDFIREPDGVGGCEVRIRFRDVSDDPPKREVVFRLRRSWRLSSWKVTEMTAEDVPSRKE
jgi:hypothetical protein